VNRLNIPAVIDINIAICVHVSKLSSDAINGIIVISVSIYKNVIKIAHTVYLSHFSKLNLNSGLSSIAMYVFIYLLLL
jgi:hypothetical protein